MTGQTPAAQRLQEIQDSMPELHGVFFFEHYTVLLEAEVTRLMAERDRLRDALSQLLRWSRSKIISSPMMALSDVAEAMHTKAEAALTVTEEIES